MTRWMLTYGADLDCRFWGDECVVHHALSNDTHRLAAWAGHLLLALQRGALPAGELHALQEDIDPTDIDEALSSLALLDLVSRC
ncbi:hypothetical protein BH11PSE10_BH11PSE10_16540 [soil metagenome]